MQFSSRLKTRQLHALLHQVGVSEIEVKKFGLRSLRSGAAGQALLNLMLQSGGVPQAQHYEAIARALGHTSLSRVTLGSYIGPLGNLLYDNNAVVFGEEEGAVGGIAPLEDRVSRLPQYRVFASREVLTHDERETSAKRAKSLVPHLPKMSPGIAMVVDADPEVVAANRARAVLVDEVSRLAGKERLLSIAGAKELAPQCFAGVGREGGDANIQLDHLFIQLEALNKTHSLVRAKLVARAQREILTSRVAHVEDVLLLRSSLDLINNIANELQKFHSEREFLGEYVAHPDIHVRHLNVLLPIYWFCHCHVCSLETVVVNNLLPIPMAGPDPGGDVEESVQEADAEMFRRARKK